MSILSPELKPIQTRYAGYHFRSRLEARYATFYNTLGIKFKYEPEGFDLGDGLYYLPDFWLPDHKFWIEIKPHAPKGEDLAKIERFSARCGTDLYVFCGDCWIPDDDDNVDLSALLFRQGCQIDCEHWWCECPWCNSLGIHWLGRSDRLSCKQHPEHPCPTSSHGDKGYNSDSPHLVRAYLAARQARFEHAAA